MVMQTSVTDWPVVWLLLCALSCHAWNRIVALHIMLCINDVICINDTGSSLKTVC